MSRLNDAINASLPDKVYYDVVVSNIQSTTTQPKVFQYSDTRTTPYIQNPELYEMSIIRATLDTTSAPVFIPFIQTGQDNPNLTIYSVTLEYNGYEKQVYVEWNPQDKSVAVPSPPSKTANGQQYNATGYYNCYSYSWFIERVYAALQQAFAFVREEEDPPTVYPPLINWDSSSQSAVMYADVNAYDVTNDDHISVYFNAPLFALFSSFPASYLGYVGVTNGKNHKLTFTDIGGINSQTIIPPDQPVPEPPATYITWNAITWYQEYSTIASWSPILSIVFTSNTLPINPNQVSTPLIYNDNNTLSLGGNNSDIANIITDMVSDNGLYRPNIVYNPTAEYRRITLRGNRPLYNLDMNIFYKDRLGQLIPFTLNSGSSCTIKILFEKKK